MPYLECPNCRLRRHSGVLYAAYDSCPRCGAPFHPARRGMLERALRLVSPGRRPTASAPDWEQITVAQYAERRYVNKPEPPMRDGDETPAT